MEEQDISSFLAACAKKFCSDKCRYDFWNFEKRHKAEKLEMEARLNENR